MATAGSAAGQRTDRSAFASFARAVRVPSLRRVVIAFGLTSAIEASTWLAIGLYAYERTGAAGVGVAGLAILLPSALAAPVAAGLADRHRRKRVLLAASSVQAVAVAATAAAVAFDAPSAVAYGLAALASLALTPVRPAQGAFLPSISVEPADLTAANAALSVARNLGLLGGPVVVGLFLEVGGPAAGFGAAAALAVVATGLLWRVPDDAPRSPTGHPPGRHLVEGLRLLLREERAALVVGVTFAKHVVMGAIRSFLVIAPLGLLGMGDGGAGLLSAALGVGGVLGGAAAVLLVGRRRLTPALIAGAFALGIPLVATGLRPGVGLAVVALAVAGCGRSLLDITGRTLIGRVSPEEALARFLGILESSSFVGLALGSVATALLVEAGGIRTALLVAGGFLPVLAVVLIRPLAAIDQGPVVSRDRLDLILGVPMFAALPPEGVERLASHLVPTTLEAGVVVVEQGEVGDRYYLLEDGAVEAVIDGVVVSTSGSGTGFGEIALLRDVPRTATVRTTAPSRLLAVDRSHFLSVVTGEPASRLEADQLVAQRLLRDAGRHGRGAPADPDAPSAADLLAEGCLPRSWARRWRSHPERRVVRDVDGTWLSGADLLDRTAKVAGRLSAAGLVAGDRVLLSGAASGAFVVAHCAALRSRLVVVPVNGACSQRELTALIDAAQPRAAILEGSDLRARARVAAPDLLVVGIDVELPDGPPPPLDTAEPADPALLPFTSGTTGAPKGVPLSHGNLLASCEAVRVAWRWSDDDALILCLPLFHVHGLAVGLHGALLTGGTVLLHAGFDAEAVLADAAGATMLFGVPTMWTRLAAADGAERLRSLRLCVSGSAPMSEELHAEVRERCGQVVLERYGMTETIMLVSNPYEGERRAGSVGVPLPGVELRLGAGDEIEVRGPNVFAGYLDAPEADAASFTDDGWFRTGDVGALDPDGYVRIVGRAKELIITGGFNVYPREVEDVLRAHPGVDDVAVVGTPSAEWGETVTAYVEARPGFDGDALVTWAAEQLSSYKRPRLVHRIEALPRNGMGKVVRSALRPPVPDAPPPDDPPTT